MILKKWKIENRKIPNNAPMQRSRTPSDSPSQSDSSAISGRRSTIAFFIPGVRSSNASYTQLCTARSSTTCKHTPLWALWDMILKKWKIKNRKIPNNAPMQRSRTPSDSPSQSDSSAISGRRSTVAFFIPGVRSSIASYTQLCTARSSTTCKHTPLWDMILKKWKIKNRKIPNNAPMQRSRTPSDSPSQSDSSAISGRRSHNCIFYPRRSKFQCLLHSNIWLKQPFVRVDTIQLQNFCLPFAPFRIASIAVSRFIGFHWQHRSDTHNVANHSNIIYNIYNI